MTVDELNMFLQTHFGDMPESLRVESVTPDGVRVRLPFQNRSLRPGGHISGPTMMLLADTVAYASVLATGDGAVAAVTSNLNIHFLRPAPPGDLVGSGIIRKRGRRLSLVNVSIIDQAERL